VLSPLLSNKRPLGVWFPSDEQRAGAIEQARQMVEAGKGHLLIALPTWYYAISAQSLLARVDEPDDAWISGMAASSSPVLCVAGGAESRVPDWRATMDALAVPDKKFVVIDGADHNFIGSERAVADLVTGFILDKARG